MTVVRCLDGDSTALRLPTVVDLDDLLVADATLPIDWPFLERMLLASTSDDSFISTIAAEGKDVSIGVLLGDSHGLITLGLLS